MRALRPPLLAGALSKPAAARISISRRAVLNSRGQRLQHQHSNHGPHKEYFQTPGQTPLPDTSPYASERSYAPQIPPQTQPGLNNPTGVAARSLFVRAFRSVSWAIFFSSLGVLAGTSLITWEYIQPPFEAGSEMEEELLAEIQDVVEFHPLVDSLRQANWIEDNYYVDSASRGQELGDKGQHMVAGKLQGIQGITMRTFKHPTQAFTIMVAFLGFGLEGWPDVVHGGIITSLVEEGIERHVNNFYSNYGSEHAQAISIDFKRRVRPGEVYAVVLPPALLDLNPPHPEVMHLQVRPMVVRLEAPPRITQDTMEIELPSLDELHALAKVVVRLVQDVTPERMAELGLEQTLPQVDKNSS